VGTSEDRPIRKRRIKRWTGELWMLEDILTYKEKWLDKPINYWNGSNWKKL
jgi:hypothetical protein